MKGGLTDVRVSSVFRQGSIVNAERTPLTAKQERTDMTAIRNHQSPETILVLPVPQITFGLLLVLFL